MNEDAYHAILNRLGLEAEAPVTAPRPRAAKREPAGTSSTTGYAPRIGERIRWMSPLFGGMTGEYLGPGKHGHLFVYHDLLEGVAQIHPSWVSGPEHDPPAGEQGYDGQGD